MHVLSMIQRIQTLYIIIGTLFILASCICLPYFQCDLDEKNIYLMNEWGGSLWIITGVIGGNFGSFISYYNLTNVEYSPYRGFRCARVVTNN